MATPTAQSVYHSLIPLFRDQCKVKANIRNQVATQYGLSAAERIIFHQLCLNDGTYTIENTQHSTNLIQKKEKVQKKLIDQLQIDTNVTLHHKLKKISCIHNEGKTDLTTNRTKIVFMLNKIDFDILNDIPQDFLNKVVLIADIETTIDVATATFLRNNTVDMNKIDIEDTILKFTAKNKSNKIDQLANKFEIFDASYAKYGKLLENELNKIKSALTSCKIGKFNKRTKKWEEDLVYTFWSFKVGRKRQVILDDELFTFTYGILQKVLKLQTDALEMKNNIKTKRKNKMYTKCLESMSESKRAARQRKRDKTKNDNWKIKNGIINLIPQNGDENSNKNDEQNDIHINKNRKGLFKYFDDAKTEEKSDQIIGHTNNGTKRIRDNEENEENIKISPVNKKRKIDLELDDMAIDDDDVIDNNMNKIMVDESGHYKQTSTAGSVII